MTGVHSATTCGRSAARTVNVADLWNRTLMWKLATSKPMNSTQATYYALFAITMMMLETSPTLAPVIRWGAFAVGTGSVLILTVNYRYLWRHRRSK